MLHEICDKGSFGNDSRYTFCDRQNDKGRRYLLKLYQVYFDIKKNLYYRQVDAVRYRQYCWLFMHCFSPTRQPQVLYTFIFTSINYQSTF